MLDSTIAGYKRSNVFTVDKNEFARLSVELANAPYRAFRFVNSNFEVTQVLYPLYAEYGIDVLLVENCNFGNLVELAKEFNAVIVTTNGTHAS